MTVIRWNAGVEGKLIYDRNGQLVYTSNEELEYDSDFDFEIYFSFLSEGYVESVINNELPGITERIEEKPVADDIF